MEKFPGQDIEFFVVIDGNITGPIEGLEKLFSQNIAPDTPVWYEGLDDWQPAIMAPLTRQIFTPGSDFMKYMAQQADNINNDVATPQVSESVNTTQTTVEQTNRQPASAPAVVYATTDGEVFSLKRPHPYLIWSIVVLVVFNLICGVIALIYSYKVKIKFAKGYYESAKRCSETTQWWIAIGICCGLIMTVGKFLTGTLF